MRPCCRSSSAITGASLIASGRVPKTVSVLSPRATGPQRAGVQVILDRPADLATGDVFRPLAVAAEKTAGAVLQRFEVAQRPIGARAFAEPVPDHRILRE